MRIIKKCLSFLTIHWKITVPVVLVCLFSLSFAGGYSAGAVAGKAPALTAGSTETPVLTGSTEDAAQTADTLSVGSGTLIIEFDENGVPLGAAGTRPLFTISDPASDITQVIQDTFNEAAKTGGVVEFKNGETKTYRITRTLLIPANITIRGNGVTLQIDSSAKADGSEAFSALKNEPRYVEFAIMTDGFPAGAIAAAGGLSIENVNFTMYNDADAGAVPKTLFGLGWIRDASISYCSFSVYSSTLQSLNPFDVYSTWENINVSGCTFTIQTDAPDGGVWVRNLAHQGFVSGNLVMQNNTFNKRSGGEMLTVCAQSDGALDGVYIRNNSFDQKTSQSNNPAHFISLGETGVTRNIYFENNDIRMDQVVTSIIKISSMQDNPKGTTDGVYIRGNTIAADDVKAAAGQIIASNMDDRTVIFENNDITVNAKSGIKKHGVQGKSVQVLNNRFMGNGFATIANNVRLAADNTVESCESGFIGVVEIVGNTVNEATVNMVQVNSAILSATPSAGGVIIRGNSFSSSNRAVIHVTGAAVSPAITIEDNVFNNVRINNTNNPSANFYISGNSFNIGTLGDINTSGRTQIFFGNTLINFKGAQLLSKNSAAPPAAAPAPGLTERAHRYSAPSGSSSFDQSIPVGSVVWFEIDGDFVAFTKIESGTGRNTWEALPMYDMALMDDEGEMMFFSFELEEDELDFPLLTPDEEDLEAAGEGADGADAEAAAPTDGADTEAAAPADGTDAETTPADDTDAETAPADGADAELSEDADDAAGGE